VLPATLRLVSLNQCRAGRGGFPLRRSAMPPSAS
jgi:hypothetical protein